ncbi:prospero homeobox protein 1-like [Megalops cyprinoides]|uniref:prospero homeobox protein 1-like n=1 Tax=Megalops cyprinoides TaxID=118141 RepID=UPI0018647F44|nr:prospero homeobox protein 1-like [Megalops cyprinoides]
MNLSFSNHDMHTSRELHLKESQAELQQSSLQRSLYDDPLTSYCSESVISQLLWKTVQDKKAEKGRVVYLPATAMPSHTLTDPSQEDRSSNSSKGSVAELSSLMSHTSTVANLEADRPLTEHHQAKRARVESIIRGMSESPNGGLLGEGQRKDTDARDAGETVKESRRKCRPLQHRAPSSSRGWSSKDEECQKLKAQLQAMQRLLGDLQQRFLQVCQPHESEAEDREEVEDMMDPPDQCEAGPDSIKVGQRETTEVDSIHLTFNKGDRNLPEALKYELSKAVSKSVDLVFKNLSSTVCYHSSQPQVEQVPGHGYVSSGTKTMIPGSLELSPNREDAKSTPLEHYEKVETSEDQTEALSLVICRPPLRPCSAVDKAVKMAYHTHQVPLRFNRSTSLEENQILEHLLKHTPHGNLGSLSCLTQAVDPASLNPVAWEAIKVRSKVNSSLMDQQAPALALGQVAVDSLCHSHVSVETRNLQGMTERKLYMSLNIQEGLTPNHLKKAKLMFFYTRYPNSNVLKTFFPDIKFNRCITSQLIKWFSNFREFYYIQMEKFARQSIVDGVTNVKDLSVTRDSELFRALNTHYNKASDFQVPGRFLEVAEITLREFFNAISQAKDSDPSWKKAIYKVICKLDSDVPEEFKSTVCL